MITKEIDELSLEISVDGSCTAMTFRHATSCFKLIL